MSFYWNILVPFWIFQFRLLTNGFKLLKTGGTLVYSTCRLGVSSHLRISFCCWYQCNIVQMAQITCLIPVWYQHLWLYTLEELSVPAQKKKGFLWLFDQNLILILICSKKPQLNPKKPKKKKMNDDDESKFDWYHPPVRARQDITLLKLYFPKKNIKICYSFNIITITILLS